MRRDVLLGVVALLGLLYLAARKVAPETIAELERAVGENVEELIARLEGWRAEPYQDQAGLWTIGFGHLIVPGDGFWHPDFNPTGKRSLTLEEGRALYDRDSTIAAHAVDSYVSVPLTESQRTALISLVFNIGVGNFSASTLLRKLNSGDYAGAAEQFDVWNKVREPGTGQLVVSNGLVKRRAQEKEIFLA